jgi:cytochrome c oxidase assembly protein subunit 15
LYPAIVTLHLLGGLLLLGLLAVQYRHLRAPPLPAASGLQSQVVVTLLLLSVQIALGGWVSSNYAVLACSGFPQCNGQWWPAMDFREGFTLLRELGRAGHGGFLPFEALVAVHYVHRLFALFALAALLWLARALWRQPALRAQAKLLLGLTALQLATGLSNVVFDWPLAAALLHNAGAAALVLVLSLLLARAPRVPAARP